MASGARHPSAGLRACSALGSIPLAAAILLFSASALAGDGSDGQEFQINTDELDTTLSHEAGEITTRLSVDVGTLVGIGGDDGVGLADTFTLGLSAGAGYFPIDILSADMDFTGDIIFADEGTEFTNVTITPGTHVYPVDQIFIRGAVPYTVTGNTGASLLAGLGYEYPVSDSQNIVGEIDFIYPLNGEGDGTVTLGGGTSFSF